MIVVKNCGDTESLLDKFRLQRAAAQSKREIKKMEGTNHPLRRRYLCEAMAFDSGISFYTML
jgi:hypothetical protein